MKVTYIHHSSFLVETESCYYLFDYENGTLPELDIHKPIFVLSSHGHPDHYNPQIFSVLNGLGMKKIQAVLSNDITPPSHVVTLAAEPNKEYSLCLGQKLTTFQSTDLGVAFLIDDGNELIYHAGDLNDWVWEGEDISYNTKMTLDYQLQINLLALKLKNRKIDCAFVVLDPRQEKDFARGMLYFLKKIHAERIYPMHYWEKTMIIAKFLQEYPEYRSKIFLTEQVHNH